MRLKAKAIAKVTVEVKLPDSWSDEFTLKQIRQQAADSAAVRISGAMTKNMRMVSEPIITIVTLEDK